MDAASQDDSGELATLVRASAEGDREAFATLYRRTSANLFGICANMLHDRGEAEDALQHVYIAVWRRAGSYDAACAATMTWLITITRNHCIDRLRKRREFPLDADKADRLVDPLPGPLTLAAASQQRQQIERCMDTLADEQKSAVRAAFFSGRTYKQLADRRGVPLATMKSWIRRSLIRLRRCLEHSS